ncbi:predicted protein [Thalassiosira pseudonana CCMP1335]|uniref:Uncharacterized protein n=1 Tax=Thalassiosira pseudonana TaxID=35128 RepID=B8CB68_THAPS|nr:predicted protein [Thalassiosira pseudonana CCMP1335]EED89266.1 predicted protein [Thalassiosira pseudonana CCMP1335]
MPPPPPPSASYNLVIVDSSDEEDDIYGDSPTNAAANERFDTATSTAARGISIDSVQSTSMMSVNGGTATAAVTSNDIPWAEVVPTPNNNRTSNKTVVEATSVAALSSPELDGDDSEDDGGGVSGGEGAVATKKKKKKKKKRKKKKSKIDNSTEVANEVNGVTERATESISALEDIKLETTTEAINATNNDAATDTPCKQKSKSKKSISFGSINVREYARTLGTHVVPADGGWPLGLSGHFFEHGEHTNIYPREMTTTGSDAMQAMTINNEPPPSLPKHQHHGWTIADFESRKQLELRQRYTQLIHEQRKRKFEKEWEKKHLNKFHSGKSGHGYSTRRNKRSGSSSGGGGGGGRSASGRSSSGMLKNEMTAEEKEELERIMAQPVVLPEGIMETRPYDYKKKLSKGVKSPKNAKVNPDMTEEEELYTRHGGRNPLFMALKEDERRKVLIRDDQWYKQCHVIDEKDDDRCRPFKSTINTTNDDGETPLDLTDTTTTQHIQHDLESLRIQRSDPTNLGCSCRKLHVFLPGGSDKSHHKKKGSHRRLPERKVREELRRRALLHEGNNNITREKAEKLLHDAIEKEGCCWGNDCPCFRSGIECQADTCNCWHPSHDVAASNTKSTNKSENTESRNVVDQDVADAIQRCGNVNGMYVVNFHKIKRHREQYVTGVDVKA